LYPNLVVTSEQLAKAIITLGLRVPNRLTSKHKEHISAFLNLKAIPDELVKLYKTLKPGEKAMFLTKLMAFVIPNMESHEISQEISAADARAVLNAILDERGNHDNE